MERGEGGGGGEKEKRKGEKKEKASLLRSTPVKNAISVFTRRLRVPSSACPRVSARGVCFTFEKFYIYPRIYVHCALSMAESLIGLSITRPIAGIDRTSSFRHAGLMTAFITLRELTRNSRRNQEFHFICVHQWFRTARVNLEFVQMFLHGFDLTREGTCFNCAIRKVKNIPTCA